MGKFRSRFIFALWSEGKGLCKKIGESANLRLGESVSDLYRAKIRLGKFKALYSTSYFHSGPLILYLGDPKTNEISCC